MHYYLVVAILLTLTLLPANAVGQNQPASKTAEALYAAQNWAEAAIAYENLTRTDPQNGRIWYRLGYSRHALGQYDRAVAAFARAVEIGHNPVSMYGLACAFARLGDRDHAFEWLEKALNAGLPNPSQIQTDADLAAIRDDARFKQVAMLADRAARPCENLPEYKQFEFWVGDWDVQTPQGQRVGANRVERLEAGCVVMENWTGLQGGTGKSINFYDATTRKWRQTWVSSTGNVSEFQGEFKDGAMQFLGSRSGQGGGPGMNRLTFFNLGPDRVRQLAESSSDGGKTWSVVYDFIYIRKGRTASSVSH